MTAFPGIRLKMSSAVEHQICNAGGRNNELLDVLSATDGAASALAEHKRYLEDLKQQLGQSDQRVKKLDTHRQQRLGEHEKYRDSHVRRFMFKASGKKEKFAQRAEEGEREYFKALQDSQQEQNLNAALKTQLDEGSRAQPDLQAEADRHDAAQRDLDALYSSIFDGPTPQFPEEDAREQRYAAAQHAHQRTRAMYDAETHAVDQLNLADKALSKALHEIDGALGYSRMDMFGGGMMSDMMERSHLSQADRLITMARVHVERAQRASPHVRELPHVEINHGNIMSDVFFDNIMTDYAFHQEIKRGQADVMRCYNCLQDLGHSADRRRMELETQLQRQGEELKTARADLQRAREQVFQSVLRQREGGGGDTGGAAGGDAARGLDRTDSLPPAYEDAVNRTSAPAYTASENTTNAAATGGEASGSGTSDAAAAAAGPEKPWA